MDCVIASLCVARALTCSLARHLILGAYSIAVTFSGRDFRDGAYVCRGGWEGVASKIDAVSSRAGNKRAAQRLIYSVTHSHFRNRTESLVVSLWSQQQREAVSPFLSGLLQTPPHVAPLACVCVRVCVHACVCVKQVCWCANGALSVCMCV